MRIIRNCDNCLREDSINCKTGLCPSCETEILYGNYCEVE
jgi:hypothetical protein